MFVVAVAVIRFVLVFEVVVVFRFVLGFWFNCLISAF